jgi:protein-tyrosine phosphatase
LLGEISLIDIHNHILHGVDNGSVSLLQTKNMLKIAFSQGVRRIIATPNYGVGCVNPTIHDLYKKLEVVQEEAKKINSNFLIELGNEVYYSDDLIEHLRKNKALTLAGTKYVLVSFASSIDYKTLKTGLHRLLIHGYYPILSQIEKYDCLYLNYSDINELIQLGVCMQMNSASVLGNIFNKKTNYCKQLIGYELVHFIATDAHSDTLRVPTMKESYELISKKYAPHIAYQIFYENGDKLLNNEYISRVG